jgi:hypothetical protein
MPPPGAVLYNFSVGNMNDSLGMLHHARIVGGKDKRHAHPLVQLLHQRDDLIGSLGVQVGSGLIGQHQLWMGDERAGNRHPLTLSSG